MLQKIYLFLIILFLTSCAGVVSPTGGPRDTTPPVCVKKNPADNTINFNKDGIVFSFDEFVVLSDISNQFIISPPLNKKPDIIVRGKKIEILFKEPLKEQTTYTLNFGNGIVDNNEANVLQGLSYTFSTGDYIDSLELHGYIADAFTLLPSKETMVGLYKADTDSTIFKEKPWYVVKPDSSGHFHFSYLSPGEYKLVGFEDLNKNIRIEPNEKLAFYSTKIDLNYQAKDTLEYVLQISPQYNKKKANIITYKEIAKQTYQIITTGSNCNLSILTTEQDTTLLYKTGKTCDTVTVFTTKPTIDTAVLLINVDTLSERIAIPCKSKSYIKFAVTSSNTLNNYNFLEPLKIAFNTPPISIDTKNISLFKDSIQLNDFEVVKDSINPLLIKLIHNWKENSKYTVSIAKSSIKDIYQQNIDSFVINISTVESATLGNLSIDVNNKNNAWLIVQLLNSKSEVVEENTITETKTISYKNIAPGQYFIKVIEDLNKNNNWDGANYFEGKQAERVYITPQSTEVRASWDVEGIKIEPTF